MTTGQPGHPITPDGRYFLVRGRLWRMSNPTLPHEVRYILVSDLMTARRAVREAKKAGNRAGEAAAHEAVDRAKRALGERGTMVRPTTTGTW
jgi:hypothetical protein